MTRPMEQLEKKLEKRLQKEVESRRDAASTASYDSGDDYIDDSSAGDGEDEDSGERRVETVTTINPRRQRCQKPSSPRTRERHRRAQRIFDLSDSYQRVFEYSLLWLTIIVHCIGKACLACTFREAL